MSNLLNILGVFYQLNPIIQHIFQPTIIGYFAKSEAPFYRIKRKKRRKHTADTNIATNKLSSTLRNNSVPLTLQLHLQMERVCRIELITNPTNQHNV